ncbi:GIY-YIG nuclease family protein [Candidatus Kaiserbacteria bacterium]|nr:GIY-YIG nuclease family protein [Candidatus Kaiserbacteria bacterium]
MAYFVYILECSDGTLYTGVTNDLERRLHRHNTAKAGAKYTASRRPVRLLYSEKRHTKSAALKRECKIKSLSRKEKRELIGIPSKKATPFYSE